MSRAIGGLNEIFIYGRSPLREVGRGNDQILPRSEARSAIKIHGPKKGPSTVCERHAVVDISGNLMRAGAPIGNDLVQNRKRDARRFELFTSGFVRSGWAP
jgi:hypothetical protein